MALHWNATADRGILDGMMRFVQFGLAAISLATPALADTPLGAAEFEAYVTGKTLYYEAAGIAYGVEEYRPGRRVRWSVFDGACKTGEWYPAGDAICFEYDDGTGPQCWRFFRAVTGLRAEFEGDPPGTDLYETRATDEPLVCLGPEVGV